MCKDFLYTIREDSTREDSEFDVTLGPKKTSITYEDYLALNQMREDISVGMNRVEFYKTLIRCGNAPSSEIDLKWKCNKKKHAWQANYQKIRNGDGCPRCSKSSKLNTYTTKDLIEDLRNEIQQLSEELALIFPERLVTKHGNKYSDQTLSKIWGRNEKYVSSYVIKRTKEDPNFTIKEKDLILLKENIEKKLGMKARSCSEIIKKYQNNGLNTLQFIDILEKELGRVSGELKISDEELGMILTGTHGFIKNVFTRIMYSSHHSYNPHYKFSKERLSEIREFLNEIFGNKAKKCIELIKKYEKLNPDLKEYSLQQYTITRPNYFHNIEKFPEKSYWFGFLSADATRAEKNGRITIKLALKDKYLLEKFAKAVGLPIDRIKFRLIYRRYKGELKEYKTAILRFACKPMGMDLDKLGFRSTKNELNSLPNYVVQCLSKAKKKSKQEKIEWWQTLSGKVALGYLLGFYDGDGTYKGGKSAGIYAKNKTYLNHIKELFKIKNKIITTKVPGEIGLVFDQECTLKGCYRISLGPKLFEIMMKSYDGSLKRKRLLKKKVIIMD
ncbi:MAG: zinc-ribbon domain-containing protein [Candidatus Lokiarchaeota archaeon]|nr:zinc-ribbon domain-containing protein [Candidatus Lokiarchaeota archaeon]